MFSTFLIENEEMMERQEHAFYMPLKQLLRLLLKLISYQILKTNLKFFFYITIFSNIKRSILFQNLSEDYFHNRKQIRFSLFLKVYFSFILFHKSFYLPLNKMYVNINNLYSGFVLELRRSSWNAVIPVSKSFQAINWYLKLRP